MAGWELMPSGSGEIRELVPLSGGTCQPGKIIGRFSHCKLNKDGELAGLKVEGGPEMRITRETIKPDGYRIWQAARHMDTSKDRRDCAKWVWQLIAEGKLKQEEGQRQ